MPHAPIARTAAYSGTPAFLSPSMNTSQWAKFARFRRNTLSRTGGPSLLRAAMYSCASSISPRCPQQLISEWYWPTCSDSRDGGAKVRQRLLELPRAKQRQAVDRRVESGKAVDRAHAQGPSGLHERLVEMTGAQQRPPEHDVAEREARVEVERGLELAERPLMLPRRAEAQPEDHPRPRVGRIVLQGILRMGRPPA